MRLPICPHQLQLISQNSLAYSVEERAREFAHRLKCGDYKDASQQVNNLKAVPASIAGEKQSCP
jgi:hypothetical protein